MAYTCSSNTEICMIPRLRSQVTRMSEAQTQTNDNQRIDNSVYASDIQAWKEPNASNITLKCVSRSRHATSMFLQSHHAGCFSDKPNRYNHLSTSPPLRAKERIICSPSARIG